MARRLAVVLLALASLSAWAAGAAADPVPRPLPAEAEAPACVPGMSSPGTAFGGSIFLARGGVWSYEETNGLPGLQRGDRDRQDDTCGGDADSFAFLSFADLLLGLVPGP